MPQSWDMGHCFTSLPKEGILWIISTEKIQRLRSGANPRSWVPEASMQTPRPLKLQVGQKQLDDLNLAPRQNHLIVSVPLCVYIYIYIYIYIHTHTQAGAEI
jgi:hypothetical protein